MTSDPFFHPVATDTADSYGITLPEGTDAQALFTREQPYDPAFDGDDRLWLHELTKAQREAAEPPRYTERARFRCPKGVNIRQRAAALEVYLAR